MSDNSKKDKGKDLFFKKGNWNENKRNGIKDDGKIKRKEEIGSEIYNDMFFKTGS